MWEKYYGWTPYHYSANNPVSFLDPGGEEIVKQNILSNSLANEGFDLCIEFWKNVNSPTVNAFLYNVLDENSDIKLYINTFSDYRNSLPEKKTESNLAKGVFLEDIWSSHLASGMTLKSPKKNDRLADILLSTEGLENCHDKKGNIKKFYESMTVVVLDELHHGQSPLHNSSVIEHCKLFESLYIEIINSIIDVPKVVEDQIIEKVDNP
jgi:hypothetical protein